MGYEPYEGEPDINRLLGAFKREKIDRVPNFEVLIEDQHVEKMLGRYAGNTLAIGGDPAKGVEEAEGARTLTRLFSDQNVPQQILDRPDNPLLWRGSTVCSAVRGFARPS